MAASSWRSARAVRKSRQLPVKIRSASTALPRCALSNFEPANGPTTFSSALRRIERTRLLLHTRRSCCVGKIYEGSTSQILRLRREMRDASADGDAIGVKTLYNYGPCQRAIDSSTSVEPLDSIVISGR